MQTRNLIAAVISLPVNAVLFGAAAIVVLTVPSLRAHAAVLLPVVIVASFVLTFPVSWVIAPRLRSRRNSSASS